MSSKGSLNRGLGLQASGFNGLGFKGLGVQGLRFGVEGLGCRALVLWWSSVKRAHLRGCLSKGS